MGIKAENKKEYIFEQARKVFAEKGYKDVTMRDIVAACQISRGGVYLYYDSTSAIFEEILKRREKEHQALLPFSEDRHFSAVELMRDFLSRQKEEVLHPADSLILATYEYLFAQRRLIDPSKFAEKFTAASSVLQEIIQFGVDRGEFLADVQTAAHGIIFWLEGLRVSSTVIALEEAQVDDQIAYVIDRLTLKP